MMPSKRLRERQAAMRSRHSEVRPWDHVKDLAARDMILSIRRLIDLGCTDKQIGKAVGLNPSDISLLRGVKHRRPIL